uniref:Uncharacterized protein n=1 Tax=uncultured bacterium fosmid pJB71G8 TaxID=1478068 RepID=A0A0H3U7P5_9BACT|nr:hypothetical protein [uncultured bacterium fosmid pJB71G8]
MKRLASILLSMVACTSIAWCGITVSVPVQLINGQSDQLPDKTIEATFKQVKLKDNAPATLVTVLDSLFHIVTENAGTCRTFAIRINDDYTQFNITNIDPLEPMGNGDEVMGTMIVDRYHFLVMRNAMNKDIINAAFKIGGDKIKYVREFEFVEEKMDPIITCVEAEYVKDKLTITRCVVDGFEIE